MIYIVDNNGTFSAKVKGMVLSHAEKTKLVSSEKPGDFRGAAGVILTDGPATKKMLDRNVKIVRKLAGKVSILGIGLGMRAIVEAFGGEYHIAPKSTISREANMIHDEDGVYMGLPSPTNVGRYSNLHPNEESLPRSLFISAHTWDGEVMGIRHREFAVEGINFHPGSVKTDRGDKIIQAFVENVVEAGVSR